MSKQIEKQAIDNLEKLTVKIAEQIESFYGEMNHLSLQIMHNPILMDSMKQASMFEGDENYFAIHIDTERKVRDNLASFNGPDLLVSRISMYNDQRDFVSLGIIPEDPEIIRSRLQSDSFKQWYQSFTESGYIEIEGPHSDSWSSERDQQIISLYRPFGDVSTTFGVIEIQQMASKLDEILQFPNSDRMNVYVINREGQPIYMNQEIPKQMNVTIEQLLKGDDRLTGGSFTSDHGYLKQIDHILTYNHSQRYGWTLVLAESRDELLSPVKVVGKLFIILGFMFMLLGIAMVFFISRELTKPFRTLRNSIRNINLDSLSLEIDDTSNEIILVKRTFDQMFERLKESMEQVVQTRSRELRARMNALQSQMHPHFLYNVLTIIGSTGQQAGDDKVMDMCEKLSDMLRYITNHKGTEVLLREELTYAQAYVEFMKERYEDHFHYHFEVDERTLSSKVPRLILQPLIENCFQHAFQMASPPWVIHISIRQTPDESWLIEVKDWGTGFDSASLNDLKWRMLFEDTSNAEQLNKQEQSTGVQGGIGLFNTVVRLKLAFGQQAFFEILNNDPTGTIVRIGRKRI